MIPELKGTTWQRVWQTFSDDPSVSRRQLDYVRRKLQKYAAAAPNNYPPTVAEMFPPSVEIDAPMAVVDKCKCEMCAWLRGEDDGTGRRKE